MKPKPSSFLLAKPCKKLEPIVKFAQENLSHSRRNFLILVSKNVQNNGKCAFLLLPLNRLPKWFWTCYILTPNGVDTLLLL